MARSHIGQCSLGTPLCEVASIRPDVEVEVVVVLAWRGAAMQGLAMAAMAAAGTTLPWFEGMAVWLTVGPPLGVLWWCFSCGA
jgi:hypothetical protein